MIPFATLTASAADVVQTTAGTKSYSLFNNGRGDSSAAKYSSTQGKDANPDSHSLTNNGYDIYGQMNQNSTLTIGMGLSFYISSAVTEKATLTVYAYDVDEEDGEYDIVYLVDETTGSKVQVGSLTGMNDKWSTTTIDIDPSLFEVGHTYHFENEISSKRSGPVWWVYLRTVAIELTLGGGVVEPPLEPTVTDYSFSASISATGLVSTTLKLVSNQNVDYKLEFAASVNGEKKGMLDDVNTSICC